MAGLTALSIERQQQGEHGCAVVGGEQLFVERGKTGQGTAGEGELRQLRQGVDQTEHLLLREDRPHEDRGVNRGIDDTGLAERTQDVVEPFLPRIAQIQRAQLLHGTDAVAPVYDALSRLKHGFPTFLKGGTGGSVSSPLFYHKKEESCKKKFESKPGISGNPTKNRNPGEGERRLTAGRRDPAPRRLPAASPQPAAQRGLRRGCAVPLRRAAAKRGALWSRPP